MESTILVKTLQFCILFVISLNFIVREKGQTLEFNLEAAKINTN